ncbi:MAG: polyprenyl diphosphate synthase [Firmicutes bacterium]|nr:polyprenyl diphosphate synthase [Bacillota bacterium]
MKSKKNSLPNHIAFIMDGNGRWAKKRLMPRTSGHKEGIKTIERLSEKALELGIKYMSYFAFSTENWSRPKSEVDYLLELLEKRLISLSERLQKNDIELIISGDLSIFSDKLLDVFGEAMNSSGSGKGGVANLCLNYGARDEIIRGVNAAVVKGKKVDEESFKELLYTNGIPDPDLLIRTGGEKRLSNFMLYQLAYTELYFCDTLWPDFSNEELLIALENYAKRERRFGGLKQ